MSTIKATNIQPQSDSDPLVFSTNATERMRIPSSGGVSITGGATVYGDIEVYNGAFVRSGGLSVTGSASISQNMTIGSSTMSTPSGSAPIFAARAWGVINTNGSSVNRASGAAAANPSSFYGGNISSVVGATGSYYGSVLPCLRVTMTVPMTDTNYSVLCSSIGQSIGDVNQRTTVGYTIRSTSQFELFLAPANTNLLWEFRDGNQVSFAVFG